MAQAVRLVSGWCAVRCDRVSTAGTTRVFNWTESNITPHRALFGCTRHDTRGLSFWHSTKRHLTTTTRSQRLPARSLRPNILKNHSSMVATPQAAHAAAQQQNQGALVWIDCEVLSASPFLLIAFLIANVSPRSHAPFK